MRPDAYSDAEIRLIKAGYEAGDRYDDIAKVLGRGAAGVKAKIRTLISAGSLPPKRKRQSRLKAAKPFLGKAPVPIREDDGFAKAGGGKMFADDPQAVAECGKKPPLVFGPAIVTPQQGSVLADV